MGGTGSRRRAAMALAAALTVLAAFGVAGHSRLSGPVLLELSGSHGVHRDDLVVLAAWLAGLWLAWRLSRD